MFQRGSFVIIARVHPRHGDNIQRFKGTIATVLQVHIERQRALLRFMSGTTGFIHTRYLDSPTEEQLNTLPGSYQARQCAEKIAKSEPPEPEQEQEQEQAGLRLRQELNVLLESPSTRYKFKFEKLARYVRNHLHQLDAYLKAQENKTLDLQVPRVRQLAL